MRDNKLYTGKQPQTLNDQLTEVSLFDLYMLINESDMNLITKIHNLQEAKMLGPDAYRNLKAKLPYYIGVEYKNKIRKPSEFISAHWFTIDLDHILIELSDEETVKQKLSVDQRIALMFTSPGGEGLKILFKLKSPITNTQQFSNFYTAFASEFARHYELEKYLDFKTKDASRICFLSVDPKAYINENPILVDPEKYISKFDLFHQNNTSNTNNEKEATLSDDVYGDILKKLNPKTPKKSKLHVVPEVLRSVMAPIENKARKMGIPVVDKKDISYGQQITFSINGIISIINLFYGKNGFTVHVTNKGQSDKKLGEVCKALIQDVLYTQVYETTEFSANEQLIMQSKATENILKN